MALTEAGVRRTGIEGLLVLTSKQVTDGRGTVREFFRASTYATLIGASLSLTQVNVTRTHQSAIRGLHGEVMSKLVGVVSGEAFGAYVDARPESRTFGTVETVSLVPGVQVFVPCGVLNGFQTVSSEGCEYLYVFDAEWRPEMPSVGAYALDPELAIDWPIEIDVKDRTLLSEKDAELPSFAELREGAKRMR